ncbi:MAG: aquaporin family protein [Chloroflexi bacterium]|nr:MAG: aquaporin family protein [Chloroflexota bacterium]
MREKGLTGELIAEAFGTFILILLGDGVVANVGLAPRLESAGYDWNTIVWGWGFAVVIAVYVAGGVTGAHINPAVTIAMAVKRDFPWSKVVPYIVAQIIGAFLGALGVYLVYMEGLQAAGMPNVWATGPGSVFGQAFWGEAGSYAAGSTGAFSIFNASVAEFFGTMVLLWGVLAVFDDRNWGVHTKTNLGALLVGFTVVAVGLSLGGPSGYSINPARDLGPRIFGALVGTKDLFNGIYWLVPPVIVPAISGAIGVFLYDWFISPFLPGGE